MDIGKLIHNRRTELGLTLEEVGNAVGVGKSTVKKWESGFISNMKRDKISLLASALKISPVSLITGEIVEEDLADQPSPYPAPEITDDVVTFPVIGDVAAGYDQIAIEDWSGDTITIPRECLHGRPKSDYFVLTVSGDSMYPLYIDGDKVLVLKADTMDHSGQVGVIMYNGDNATLKRIEYADGEDWLRMVPINPYYQPKTVSGADLEQCRVIGIPRMLVREL